MASSTLGLLPQPPNCAPNCNSTSSAIAFEKEEKQNKKLVTSSAIAFEKEEKQNKKLVASSANNYIFN